MKRLYLLLLLVLTAGSTQAQGDFYRSLADSARTLTRQRVLYDPAYRTIPYPGGDVAPDRGVCTDVVIRAYRKMGVDLQKEVHEDMKANFSLYPKNWGMKSTDRNIDHRRVPNLMLFFARKGESLPVTTRAEDYAPGDIVCWNLGGGITHIGILVPGRAGSTRPLVVHNIGAGQVVEDCLFDFTIIGHYRYKK